MQTADKIDTARRNRGRLARRLASVFLAVLGLGILYSAAPAGAAVITDRPLLFSFNGADTTAGAFGDARHLEVDQATGDVYVLDAQRAVLDKFSAAGAAQGFSATGSSSLTIPQGNVGNDSDIAIDNSGVNPGRIYVATDETGPLYAFDPAGEPLWRIESGTHQSPSPFVAACAVAVDTAGHLWLSDRAKDGGPTERVQEFDSTGSPPAKIDSFPYTNGGAFPCSIDLDSSGSVYVAVSDSDKGVYKYVGGAFDSTLDPARSFGVAVDSSSATGHIFTSHLGSFNEYESNGTLIGTFGASVLSQGEEIAYSHYDPPGPEGPLDRVYVANLSGNQVYAFGPVITGTVPDPAIEPVAAVGVSKATFSGRVNPQGVPNEYFFEWKQGTSETAWGEAKASAPQALPEDGSDHPVSLDAGGLSGDTTYQVRLVARNAANGLRAVSSPVTFKTEKAPAAPEALIGAPESVAATSARLSATIDPHLDFGTTYRFQLSTESECDSGFADLPRENLESEVTKAVSEEATGLLAAQHYCVRVEATNSFGTGLSALSEFTTQALPPSELQTSFAAPRLDTSARLNARVNPRGAPLSYRFEYSADGGSSWVPLAAREDTSGAREQIVVSEELGGLQPGTAYEYRVSAENVAGPAAGEGAVRTFTTRSTAELSSPNPCPNEDVRIARHTTYLGSCRGIEMVNAPDKGDQHVRLELLQGTQPISADGERAVWNVLSGVPGGNVGSGASFLARRSGPTQVAPNGWTSQALVPPPAQLPDGGEAGGWNLGATSPDLGAFVFDSGVPPAGIRGKTLFAVDAAQNRLASVSFSGEVQPQFADVSEHGGGILFVDPDSPHQLKDLADSPPQTISIMPDGQPDECGLDASAENRSFIGGGNDPAAAAAMWRPGYHMIATTDASRAYFQAKPNGKPCGSSLYGIYERNRDGGEISKGQPEGETLLLDPGSAATSPQFIRATPDGRAADYATYSACRRFDPELLSCQKPEPADTNSDPDIYRWSEQSGESTCLTCVVPDAGVSLNPHTILVSDDFSHVYFESTRQLVPGEGKPGDLNLYVLSAGAIRFVADLNDRFSGPLEEALLSENGDVLLFRGGGERVSGRALTADHLAPLCKKREGVQSAPAPCEELFRYDDRNGGLECLSCRAGAVTDHSVGAEGVPGDEHDFRLSADGETAAFVTSEALLPSDVNGSSDIYEWRRGALHLISSGLISYPLSSFASPQVDAISGDGNDIFFSIVAPNLTGFERDGFANLYDARINGGFEPPTSTPHCSEESCQGALQASPSPEVPVSSIFQGPGNLKVPGRRPCAAKHGRARRRCLRIHRHRSTRR